MAWTGPTQERSLRECCVDLVKHLLADRLLASIHPLLQKNFGTIARNSRAKGRDSNVASMRDLQQVLAHLATVVRLNAAFSVQTIW